MTAEAQEVQHLFDLIAECLPKAITFRDSAFRSAGVKYANETDLTSGSGASFYGGRWNPPRIAAVYASLDLNTAFEESFQEFRRYGFAPSSIQPRVFAGLSIDVQVLLDLTSAPIRRKLGFTLTELLSEDWHAIQFQGDESWTQAIGRGAVKCGFEGLLVPSSQRRKGQNIVVFPTNLRPGSTLRPMKREQLPPHPSDWPT